MVSLPQNACGFGGVLLAAGERELYPQEKAAKPEADHGGYEYEDTHYCNKGVGGWHGGTPFGGDGNSIAEKRENVKGRSKLGR